MKLELGELHMGPRNRHVKKKRSSSCHVQVHKERKYDKKWIEERPGIVPETKTSCSRHVKKKQNQSEAEALYCSIANIAERESKTYSKLKMMD